MAQVAASIVTAVILFLFCHSLHVLVHLGTIAQTLTAR